MADAWIRFAVAGRELAVRERDGRLEVEGMDLEEELVAHRLTGTEEPLHHLLEVMMALLAEGHRLDQMLDPNTRLELLQPFGAAAGWSSDNAVLVAAVAAFGDAPQRFGAACNPHCHPLTEARLARDPEQVVRSAVAGRTRRADLLELLAADPQHRLSHLVAANPVCPPELLEKLARHPGQSVRLAVAENENTPPALLRRLAKDSSDTVSRAAAHRRLPSEPSL